MVPKAVGDPGEAPPPYFLTKKKIFFGDHPLPLSKGLDD